MREHGSQAVNNEREFPLGNKRRNDIQRAGQRRTIMEKHGESQEGS